MPPPMGPNQMGYSPGQKMPGMGSGQFSHFNSQYSQQPGTYLLSVVKMEQQLKVLDERKYLVIIQGKILLILHKTICCDPSSEPS